MRTRGLLIALACSAQLGCLPVRHLEPARHASVAGNPFGEPSFAQLKARSHVPGGSQDLAFRLDMLGRRLTGANPELGIRPSFGNIGSPEPEIFHVGTDAVFVTDGLIKECPGDNELAAVIAAELGKLIADREFAAQREARAAAPPPPIHLPIGGHGNSLTADPTNLIETARYEKKYPKNRPVPVRPDSKAIARTILENAHFNADDLDAVQPILRRAEQHCAFETMMKGSGKPDGWQP